MSSKVVDAEGVQLLTMSKLLAGTLDHALDQDFMDLLSTLLESQEFDLDFSDALSVDGSQELDSLSESNRGPSIAKLSHEELANDDTIIALLGETGTGKSTFINCALGYDAALVSNSVMSCTKCVQTYRCVHPKTMSQRLVFVDTPGFDNSDTSLPDKRTLELVTNWLAETHQRNIKLTGILYFTNIAAPRVSGTNRRNLRMLAELCGPDALSNVIVVSTGWEDLENPQLGYVRERDMENLFLRDLLSCGSRYCRFPERTTNNAWGIINFFQGCGRVLQIQKEMVDLDQPLVQTSAFQAIRKTWKRYAQWKTLAS